jgi:hypothetical protein
MKIQHDYASYPGNFLRLLRLGGQAERYEHGAKRQINDFVSHVSALTLSLTQRARELRCSIENPKRSPVPLPFALHLLSNH